MDYAELEARMAARLNWLFTADQMADLNSYFKVENEQLAGSIADWIDSFKG